MVKIFQTTVPLIKFAEKLPRKTRVTVTTVDRCKKFQKNSKVPPLFDFRRSQKNPAFVITAHDWEELAKSYLTSIGWEKPELFAILYKCSKRKKEKGEEDLEFALIDRRPRKILNRRTSVDVGSVKTELMNDVFWTLNFLTYPLHSPEAKRSQDGHSTAMKGHFELIDSMKYS